MSIIVVDILSEVFSFTLALILTVAVVAGEALRLRHVGAGLGVLH